MSEKEIKSLLLRMPLELYERVKQAAIDNNIPITHFILNMLNGVESRPIESRLSALEKKVEAIEKQLKKK